MLLSQLTLGGVTLWVMLSPRDVRWYEMDFQREVFVRMADSHQS